MSSQVGGSSQEIVQARFQEVGRVLHETYGDNGIITVTARDQRDKDVTANIINQPTLEGEFKCGENVVIDPKRRMMDIDASKNTFGPTNMQMDGPGGSKIENTHQAQEITDSKNGKGAGPVNQARLVL